MKIEKKGTNTKETESQNRLSFEVHGAFGDRFVLCSFGFC